MNVELLQSKDTEMVRKASHPHVNEFAQKNLLQRKCNVLIKRLSNETNQFLFTDVRILEIFFTFIQWIASPHSLLNLKLHLLDYPDLQIDQKFLNYSDDAWLAVMASVLQTQNKPQILSQVAFLDFTFHKVANEMASRQR